MKIVCCIRIDKYWSEYKISPEFNKIWQVDEILNIWDSVFKTSYIEFRKCLSNLSKLALKDVKFDNIINQYQYSVPSNDIVVPVDDDDWFHPNIIEVLKNTNANLVYWNILNNTEGALQFFNPSNTKVPFVFETNNHALFAPKNKEYILNHTILNRDSKGKGHYINDSLSLHNRSIASISLLGEKLLGHRSNNIIHDKKKALLELYEKYQEIDVTLQHPAYFDDYLEKIKTIHKKIKIRKMFF